MIRRIRLVSAAAALVLAAVAPASADVLWNWSFGSESGTFTTDGNFADTAGAHSFNFHSFHVEVSSVPEAVGAPYLALEPVEGFLWSGSAPTEFFRDSGNFTNFSNFANLANTLTYVFVPPPSTSSLLNEQEKPLVEAAVVISPVGEVNVSTVPTLGNPELALLAVLVAGFGAFALGRKGA